MTPFSCVFQLLKQVKIMPARSKIIICSFNQEKKKKRNGESSFKFEQFIKKCTNFRCTKKK